jgi:hypothetical protein
MSSEFPGSPQLLKGALAVYQSQTPGTQPTLIVFQYNPEQLRRTLALRTPPREGSNVGNAREDILRVIGPPLETINLTVVLDATDQLEDPQQNQVVVENGLTPALAMLELLLYPATALVQQNQTLADRGEVQISPADLPLTLLVWGKSRIVPVKLTSFSVTEEAFDPDLNPIQAKVELGMQVLTYMELTPSSLGYDAYLSYQRKKEQLAQQQPARPGQSRVSTLLQENQGS